MALPLKSGADLYNNQALRLRLHNLGADPTEVGAGLIYFNTSTGLNTSQKARLYTGSAWKTIAFSEDLDVASNADFLALKDRVDLLSGDVDTDAIISNMKEVSAFLEGFAEDASLMDYLNTELGKKLDKTGGTINGVVILNGNGATNVPLNIATPSMGNTGYIRFGAGISANELGHLGFSAKGEPAMVYEGTVHPLLHSGNVGDYAVKYDNGASVDKARHSIGYDNNSQGSVNLPRAGGYISFGVDSYGGQLLGAPNGLYLYYRGISNNVLSDWKTIAFTDSTVASAYSLLTKDNKSMVYLSNAGNLIVGDNIATGETHIIGNRVFLRYGAAATYGFFLNESGNVTIGGSDLAGTGTKLHVDGVLALGNSQPINMLDSAGVGRNVVYMTTDNHLLFGTGACSAGGSTYICGTNVYLRYGSSPKTGLTLNSSGNVLIGTTTDNGAKLQVSGRVSIFDKDKDTSLLMQASQSGVMQILSLDVAQSQYNAMSFGYQHQLYLNSASSANRYVGINTNNPQYQLDVNGDLHVKGNIIADGEVSAGGRAEEGGNAGGGGAFHSESIAVGATQTTIAHGLGTDDIVVSIYEKDGVSGRWSIILTDVEIVDANNIIVSFGSATTVEHKVVIMGAVA